MGRLDEGLYAFAVPRNGEVEQWRITVNGSNVSGSKVRGPISTGDGSEGCVVDEANRALYVAQGPTGIWRIGAGPTDPTEKVMVDTTGPAGHLAADVEGLTVVDDYLLASSQGDNSFVAYERRSGVFVRKLSVVPGDTADGCEETDGIEAMQVSLNDRYPHGLFVCQDGRNGPPGSSGNQNFKFVRLENVLAPQRDR